MQGGGIGVLYLTIYASFALYNLLPAALAFALLVAVTAAAGVLAVLQDARALAVLGILGGFLAPVLVSTGSGNHVALFSYYALLNLAILGIAWFKAWRVLNVLGFVFTFGIGTLWGIDGYTPEKFATTEPFLVLFTLMYLVIPVLFAMRAEPKLRGFVDGTLMFGTPIVAFGLQSQLVADTEYGLAISAVVLALLYVGMATFLYRTQRESLRVLVEAQLALGVAFVTVAVPLALDARWTSAAWALQGAALVWLAFRQQRKLALLAGVALQALSGVAYVEQPPVAAEWPILNGYCLGALLLALAGFLLGAAVRSRRASGSAEHPPVPDWLAKLLSIALLVWAAAWWFFGGVHGDRARVDRERARGAARVRCGDDVLAHAARGARRVAAAQLARSRRCGRSPRCSRAVALVRDRASGGRTSAGSRGRPCVGSMLVVLARARGAVPAAARRAARDGVLVRRGARRVGSALARRPRGRRRLARGCGARARRGADARDAAREHAPSRGRSRRTRAPTCRPAAAPCSRR